jgi:hypothetical protein
MLLWTLTEEKEKYLKVIMPRRSKVVKDMIARYLTLVDVNIVWMNVQCTE